MNMTVFEHPDLLLLICTEGVRLGPFILGDFLRGSALDE